MRSDYRRHGFVPDDLPFVKRFEHIARTRWGWDEARIQDAYAWYRAAPVFFPATFADWAEVMPRIGAALAARAP